MTSISRLPEHPGLAAYGDLAGSLQLLGCPHMGTFILAGQPVPFRVLDGVWVKAGRFSWHHVDSSYLEQVRLSWRKDTDWRRRAAADHVIDLVQQALTAESSALWRLTLFQVRKLLHKLDVPDAPPGKLRAEALTLGITEDEVDLIAAAVRAARRGPDPAAVEELIAAQQFSRLRGAARLAESLAPVARDHVLRACLDEVRADNRHADTLLASGARLEDSGDLEKAAACYLRAAAVTADDPQIGQALRRCGPPPPRELEVQVTGRRVRLSWQPAEASAGAITYRVRREGEVSPVADGPDTCVTDPDPPAGPLIAYRVVTVREGSVESVPAVTGRFRILPDAEDFLVTEQRGGVVGRWRVPPQAAEVRVTRRPGEPGANGDPAQVHCGRTGFRDSGVTAGAHYLYQVICGYRDTTGGMAWSAGVTSSVLVSQWPDPVTGLEVTAGPEGNTIRLQWMSPPAGEILVILGTSAAMPDEGSELAAAEADPMGAVAWRGVTRQAGSPMSCEIPVPGTGVHHLAVVTVLGHRALVGPGRVIDSLEGFHGLEAQRTGDSIRLTWAWSRSSPVTLAAVRWEYTDGEHGTTTPQPVTRDSYHRRGFLISALDRGYRFTVTPLSTISGSVSVGPAATDEVEPQHDLTYLIIKTRHWWRTGRVARLQVTGQPAAGLEFLLVARPGTLRPTRMEQGEMVVRVSLTTIDAGSPADYRIDLSAVRPPYYLLGFLAGAAAAQFRLVHPSRTQLLVER